MKKKIKLKPKLNKLNKPKTEKPEINYEIPDIEDLVSKAEKANAAYRVGNPFIDDGEYDTIIEKIKKKDPKNKFINKVEKEPKPKGRKEVKHRKKMLSVEKVFSVEDLFKYFDKVNKKVNKNYEILISPKLDGLAGEFLTNSNGHNIPGLVTRGDGEKGYLIPHKIFKGIVTDDELNYLENEIRGEIVVSNKNFEKYLSEEYSHARNFVSGLINTEVRNLNETQKKALEFKIIQFVPHEDQMTTCLINSNDDNFKEKILESIDKIKSDNIFPTDGIVFTILDEEIRKEFGNTEHHYRWQIALKEKAESGETEVKGEEYQVGRTGVLTPVLKLKPIYLSGAKISSVTAHNVQMLIDEKIGVGSIIEIIRSGEIIPKIISVVKTGTPNIPKRCPICAVELQRDGLFLKCPNEICPERLAQMVFHWFKCLDNSDWFGIETIRKMSKCGFYFIDKIYEMTEDCFIECGFGETQSKNLFNSLKLSKSKQIWDWKFLAAIGIPGIEKGLSKKLLKKWNLKDLPGLKKENIIELNGFGEVISKNFEDWFSKNKDFYDRLIDLNFNIKKSKEETQKTSCIFSGKNVLFTGSIEGETRESIKALAENYNIEVLSGVSKKLDFLIIGDNPGKSKVEKAEKLGIKIITDDEFFREI